MRINKTNQFFNYSKADWQKFRTMISEKTNLNESIDKAEEIEAVVEKLTKIINNAIKRSIPLHAHKEFNSINKESKNKIT